MADDDSQASSTGTPVGDTAVSKSDDQESAGADTPSSTQAGAQAGANLIIQPEVREKFGPLLDLIIHSESMNDEERQYWINILPIMTDEQIKNLSDILQNERSQLAAIDAKYAKEIEQVGQEQFLKRVGEERQQKLEERKQEEETNRRAEEGHADDVLRQIENA
jgi:cellulose biosynthesis protein BcsQ